MGLSPGVPPKPAAHLAALPCCPSQTSTNSPRASQPSSIHHVYVRCQHPRHRLPHCCCMEVGMQHICSGDAFSPHTEPRHGASMQQRHTVEHAPHCGFHSLHTTHARLATVEHTEPVADSALIKHAQDGNLDSAHTVVCRPLRSWKSAVPFTTAYNATLQAHSTHTPELHSNTTHSSNTQKNAAKGICPSGCPLLPCAHTNHT
jgi:hypothetical protein